MQGAQLATTISVEATMVARYQRMAGRQRRLRAPLVAIDRIIDVLELRHLAGRTYLDDHVCRELDNLSALVPLTEDVTGAADTRELHSALLDLQEEVLEAVIPFRELSRQQDDE
jgi:hypothetical protein